MSNLQARLAKLEASLKGPAEDTRRRAPIVPELREFWENQLVPVLGDWKPPANRRDFFIELGQLLADYPALKRRFGDLLRLQVEANERAAAGAD